MFFKNKLLKNNFYLLLIFPISLVFSRFIAEVILLFTVVNLLRENEFLKSFFKENWLKFFLLFYFWLILSTLQQFNLEHSIKSLAYIRFILFSLGIVLILDELKKFKLFLLSIFITILFVEIDIIIQFIFGKDIFGYIPSNNVRFSGPFGDELIAGGFITQFLSIAFFALFFFLEEKKTKNLQIILFSFFLFSLAAIFITGERMSVLLVFLMLILIFLFEKKLRKNLIILFTIFLISSSIFLSKSEMYYKRYIKQNLIQLGLVFNDVDYKIKDSIYIRVWASGYNFIKNKPITGSGLKFYYHNCDHQDKFLDDIKLANCIHPHNLYLDIIGSTGLIGFTFFILFIITLIIKYKDKTIHNKKYIYLLNGSLISLIILLWPIKTSGSFFNNYSSMILYTTIAILKTNFRLSNLKANKLN